MSNRIASDEQTLENRKIRLRDPGPRISDLMIRTDDLQDRALRAVMNSFDLIAGRIDSMHASLKSCDPRHYHLTQLERLLGLDKRLDLAAVNALENYYHKLDSYENSIFKTDLWSQFRLKSSNLDNVETRLKNSATNNFKNSFFMLEKLSGKLGALSPINTLSRGYAIARDKNGKILKNTDDINRLDKLEVLLYRGRLGVEVHDINKED